MRRARVALVDSSTTRSSLDLPSLTLLRQAAQATRWPVDGRWNADVLLGGACSPRTRQLERVTCYKLTAGDAERSAEIWANMRRIVLGTVLAVALSGCATFKNTPQQDFARQAWDSCPHMANIALDYIEPSGKIHWRWVNSNAGADEHWACITKYYQEHPQPAATR